MTATPEPGEQVLDLPSKWRGTVQGTNQGSFRFTLEAIPGGIAVSGELHDIQSGWFALRGTAHFQDRQLSLELTSPDTRAVAMLGIVTASLRLQDSDTLAGTWSTGAGTEGTVEAKRTTGADDQDVARAAVLERHIRIPACALSADLLGRVHEVLSAGADRAADLYRQSHSRDPKADPAAIARLFRVGIVVKGVDGETVVTDSPDKFHPDNFPNPVSSIEFEVGLHFRLLLNKPAPNRATLKLDLSRPAALDLSNLSGEPTPNASALAVFGDDSFWVAGVFEQVQRILKQGRTRTGWLHHAYTYDAFVVVVGLPLAFVSAIGFATWLVVPIGAETFAFRAAVGIYSGIVTLVAFRLLFGLSRWLLPYMEYGSLPEPLHRRLRIALAAIFFAIVTGVLGSALWQLFGA